MRNISKINFIQLEKKRALKTSIKEGSAAGASTGIAELFVTPFALELGAKPIHIGLLSSFSSLLGQLSQFTGSKLMDKHDRKKIVLTLVFIQSLLWLPILGLSFFLWKGILSGFLPYLLIILYSFIAITGGLAHPAWFSWMGDLVPENQRGRYFSKRNLIVGSISLLAAICGGLILKYYRSQDLVLIGFSFLFFLAFIFRMISYSLFKTQYHPDYKQTPKSSFSFISFLRRYDNFGKFAVYQAFFNFAIMFASPFFAVYMYQELKFNDLTYILVTISSTLFYLMFLPFIGKFSDKYGNLRLLYLANICFVFGPLLWIFIKSPILLIIPQLITGLANAAFIISFTNFIYSSTSHEHRGICVAYTNILVGIGTFTGAILGGLLLNYISITFINKFLFIFMTASFLRLIVAIFFLPQLKEVKKVKSIPHLARNFIHPFRWTHIEFPHYHNNSEGLKNLNANR